MPKQSSYFTFILIFSLATGCGWNPPALVKLEGYVQQGPTRPPVAGVNVTLRSSKYIVQAQSDEDGYFSLILPQGTYNVDAEKEGYAGSRVIGLQISTPTRHDLTILPFFYHSWPKVPLQITLSGIQHGGSIKPNQRIRIQLSGSLPANRLLLRLGSPPSLPLVSGEQLVWNNTQDTGWFFLPQSLFAGPSGSSNLQIVAYDVNNNRTHLLVPIFLEKGQSNMDSGGSDWPALKAIAFTLAQPLSTLSGIRRPPSLFVHLSWSLVSGARGYRLYREGLLLGQFSPQINEAYDQGPDLSPGKEACYILETLLEGRTLVSQSCTTPLPAFTISLEEPTTLASPLPTFRVRSYPEIPGFFYLRLALYDLHTGNQITIFPSSPTGETTLPWPGPPLIVGRLYTWGVYQAYVTDNPLEPRAFSLSVDQAGNFLGQVLPGPTGSFEVRP